MNTHVNPDKGIRQIAPGVSCREISVGANVTTLAQTESHVFAGLGDGRVVSVREGQIKTIAQHKGAVTGLAVTASSDIISAAQDGRVMKNGADLVKPKPDWITTFAQSKDLERIAVATGQGVDVIAEGEVIASLDDFPSTVSDVAFFADANRLAVSHYGGISLWQIDRFAKPERLTWAGSMTSVSVSPNGRYVAGATQDREVHVWDLVTDRDFRLGGYRTKVKAMGWTTDTPFLYTTGADAIVAWGLASDPGAFPPKEIGYAFSEAVSAVSATATADNLPAGFTDGSIILGEAARGTAKIIRAATGAPVTRMIGDENVFCFGSQSGEVGVFRCDR